MNSIKSQFPIFSHKINGKELVYLDNAVSSQKPQVVIDAITNFYTNYNANTGRGSYSISIKATELVEQARLAAKELINAKSYKEIIFTKGATDSLNIIASCYGMHTINSGDEIVIAISEHHANIVPWQQVAISKGAVLKYIYFEDGYKLSKKDIETVITNKTKIVCVAHVSNSMGAINPIELIVKKAKSVGSIVVIDSAQSISHLPIDVQKLDIDFLVFSGHKMYAPMGVGVLYGKEDLLLNMPPMVFGGDMIEYVYEDKAEFAELPKKFEGGTKNVASIIGLGVAIDFINNIGYKEIIKHEQDLYKYAYDKLKELGFIKLFVSDPLNHSGALSFQVLDVHPHDVASILDYNGVCIRAGNHCAQPLMRHLNINSTCRVSFGIYNTKEDIDKLILALIKVREVFL
jgi:cysteine desulfurase / selenocysteine lyase